MKLRRTDDWEQVKALHTLIFPGDDWDEASAAWVLWQGEQPVGFCTVYSLSVEKDAVFMARSGIFANVRGKGIQKRMLRARERWAREQGKKVALTYTTFDNYPSIVNLLRSGYVFYDPWYQWAGAEAHYFWKDL